MCLKAIDTRRLGIQRLYFLLQTAQELPGLMALEFELLSQPFNISLLH
jgi:hypothetical protein